MLEMFDRDKLPLLLTLANEDTNSRCLPVSSIKGVDNIGLFFECCAFKLSGNVRALPR